MLLAAAATLPAAGQDFTRYVSLGDSLASGYLNGGLMINPQERSTPALLARQFAVALGLTGGLDFQQPLISEPGIPPLLALTGFSNGSPIIVPRSNQPGAPVNLNLPRPYNNLAVPGFDVHDSVATVTGNALIDIVLRGLGTQLQQAMALQPTFATVWLGNNDVLGAATSGIVIDGVTLTRFDDFRHDLDTVVGALKSLGTDLAIANIPDVTALPYVNTVPPVVVNPATRQPVLVNGAPVPLIGPDGLLTANDRVLLTASALLAQGIGIPAALGGTNQPLPDSAVLSAAEVATIQERTRQFNAYIELVASDNDAALVDVNGFFNSVAQHGYLAGGNIVYTTDFLTGGLFGYDGVHPTPMGYALAANLFIDSINAHFGTTVPHVDLTPFIFGPDGSAGMSIELPGLGNGSPIFSAAAAESLRLSLRVPTTAELERIKQRRQNRDGGDGGGIVLRLGPAPQAPATPGLRLGGHGR